MSAYDSINGIEEAGLIDELARITNEVRQYSSHEDRGAGTCGKAGSEGGLLGAVDDLVLPSILRRYTLKTIQMSVKTITR